MLGQLGRPEALRDDRRRLTNRRSRCAQPAALHGRARGSRAARWSARRSPAPWHAAGATMPTATTMDDDLATAVAEKVRAVLRPVDAQNAFCRPPKRLSIIVRAARSEFVTPC